MMNLLLRRPACAHPLALFGLLATAILFLGMPGRAGAAVIHYNEANFLSGASSALSFESFEGLTVDPGPLASISTADFTVTDPSDPGLNVRGAPESTYTAADGSNYITAFFTTGNDSITITFGSSVTDFGLTLDGMLESQPQPTASISFSTNAGDSFIDAFVGNQEPSAGQFFGFTSANPFTVLTITNTMTGDRIALDAVHYTASASSQVPLPASIALLALGLVGIGSGRYRLR